ncbi:hypothetical protein llap_6955 [Limosa lapponica baueri]|uniref:Uncharacterized protein n=1 Tax=Limosa lapponica baueri TaxID=1758121 RepID=A0A2I0U9K7_LIMLA|nr:hypothetical protein llap_6955 [Limosa lapponica baueri]
MAFSAVAFYFSSFETVVSLLQLRKPVKEESVPGSSVDNSTGNCVCWVLKSSLSSQIAIWVVSSTILQYQGLWTFAGTMMLGQGTKSPSLDQQRLPGQEEREHQQSHEANDPARAFKGELVLCQGQG